MSDTLDKKYQEYIDSMNIREPNDKDAKLFSCSKYKKLYDLVMEKAKKELRD